MSQYVAAIDQGTTSTRCMIFDHEGAVVSVGQKEHQQIFPRAGWVEHDAQEIWTNVREVVGQAGNGLVQVTMTAAQEVRAGDLSVQQPWTRAAGQGATGAGASTGGLFPEGGGS